MERTFERNQCLRFIEDSNARRLGLTNDIYVSVENEITSNLGSENKQMDFQFMQA